MCADQFDSIDPERLRSGFGVKWGSLAQGAIGAWIADMDFGVPPAVRERLVETVLREDFGYPHWPAGDPVVTAFERRMSDRFGWTPSAGHARLFTDVLQILQVVVEHTTRPGDGVAVHVPGYPPFLATIARAGRRVVPIPMRDGDDGWTFDTADLAECRLLVLVNPQNPTGRVFTRPELAALAEFAQRRDLVVFADEIHADLTHAPHRHVPFASLDESTARRTVTATSATKAFNLAAIRCAVAHIGVPRLRETLAALPLDYFGEPSLLGRVATLAAWQDSDDWLTALRARLAANRDVVAEWAPTYARRHHPPEATYLAWLDVTGRGLGPEPAARIEREAGVKLSDGAEFGEHTGIDTSSFVRLNFATSPANLRRVLDRLTEHRRSAT